MPPNFLMDYSEIRFIMAEAAPKGWIDGGEAQARVYYESAVKSVVSEMGRTRAVFRCQGANRR